jgi:hypothetical protein
LWSRVFWREWWAEVRLWLAWRRRPDRRGRAAVKPVRVVGMGRER